MKESKKQVKESYRMERIGTGMYRALATQYRKRPELSKRFEEFSDQENMHGRLFQEFYRKNFGKKLRGEKLWYVSGVLAAIFMKPLPLTAKLKKIGAVESQAVTTIEHALASGEDTGFHKILKRILPDEKPHAGLYAEVFG